VPLFSSSGWFQIPTAWLVWCKCLQLDVKCKAYCAACQILVIVSEQERQRVAVGPGNAHCMSIHQVSLRRATRAPCGHCNVGSTAAAAAVAATSAAAIRQFAN